jgi:hypothetical protein
MIAGYRRFLRCSASSQLAPIQIPKALFLLAALVMMSAASVASAESMRKRYVFSYDRATRKASSIKAAGEARKRFLKDFLADRFSPEITKFSEDIDVALDPPDQYLTTFNVISERVNDDETQVTLTVEGDVDMALMISALVENKVLSFGKEAPRVMVMPSSRFEDPKAARTLRALIFDKIKQAGLRPVAYESNVASVDFRIRAKVTPTSVEVKSLVRSAVQYGADYLIYVDAEVENKPFSQGGYISDGNFIYTILRPNGNLILGESIVSERGSGSSAMLAFDRALDSVAPVLAQAAIGQLYQAIYSDSDVVYNTAQLKQEKTLVVYWAGAPLVQAIVERLQNAGSRATLTTGMSDAGSRMKLETGMSDFELYEWFNGQTFTVDRKIYKTPVVAYSENVIEVEPVLSGQVPRRPLAKAPQPKPRPRPSPSTTSGTGGEPIARLTLKLRPAQFNR